jgi:malic enzyme
MKWRCCPRCSVWVAVSVVCRHCPSCWIVALTTKRCCVIRFTWASLTIGWMGTTSPEWLQQLRFGVLYDACTCVDSSSQYYSLVDEFMNAVRYRWPNVLVQFEDFNTAHAAGILSKYRHNHLCFNDDIQGTGATTLAGDFSVSCPACLNRRVPVIRRCVFAGLIGAVKLQGKDNGLKDQKFVVAGAGSAGMGVAAAIHAALVKEGLTPAVRFRSFPVLFGGVVVCFIS